MICKILIGPPLSGKSTYRKKQVINNPAFLVLSCDDIRMELSGGKKYVFSPQKEKMVWDIFYDRLS